MKYRIVLFDLYIVHIQGQVNRHFLLVLNEMGPGRTSLAWYFHSSGYFYYKLFGIVIRSLQEKLEQPVTGPPSPRDINNGDTAQNLSSHIDHLRAETNKLKKQLYHAQVERKYL